MDRLIFYLYHLQLGDREVITNGAVVTADIKRGLI